MYVLCCSFARTRTAGSDRSLPSPRTYRTVRTSTPRAKLYLCTKDYVLFAPLSIFPRIGKRQCPVDIYSLCLCEFRNLQSILCFGFENLWRRSCEPTAQALWVASAGCKRRRDDDTGAADVVSMALHELSSSSIELASVADASLSIVLEEV